MILTKVELQNWQGYYGTGHIVRFDGISSNSAIIYADNTTGKSAIWEAIEFGLFGEVEWGNGIKSLVGPESGDRPLMNCDAFNEKNGNTASVDLYFKSSFTGNETEYKLHRGIVPARMQGSQKGDKKYRVETTLHDLENASKPFPPISQRNLERKLLSKSLKRFCLFDGARLERYKSLLEPDEVRGDEQPLQNDIHKILKTTALKEGVQQLGTVHSNLENKLSKLRAQGEEDEEKRKELQQLNETVTDAEAEVTNCYEEVGIWEGKLKEINNQLREEDDSRDIINKIDVLEKEVTGLQTAIDDKREDIKKGLRGAWRRIISNEVCKALDGLDKSTLAQEQLMEKTGLLEGRIEGLKAEKRGEECPTCKHVHDVPGTKRKEEIDSQIKGLHENVSRLREESKHPSQEIVVTFRNAILPMRTSNDGILDDLISKESSVMSEIRKMEKKNSKIKQHRTDLEENSEDKVAELERKRESTVRKHQDALTALGMAKTTVQYWKEERRKIQPSTDTGDEEENKKIRSQERACNIAEKLHKMVEETLKIWTEKARGEVETLASEIFLEISNNSDNYESLKILDDFSVEIRNKKGGKDAGSQAQWMVVAYCLIDALGRTSGMEFPMIIDTPIRGMASKIRNKVFDHLTNMDRQFIAMPYDLELDTKTGDEKYAQLLAASYEVVKIDNDRSEIVLRPGHNLRSD